MKQKVKARLRVSRLLAPSAGRRGKLTQPSLRLLFHVCTIKKVTTDLICTATHSFNTLETAYKVEIGPGGYIYFICGFSNQPKVTLEGRGRIGAFIYLLNK